MFMLPKTTEPIASRPEPHMAYSYDPIGNRMTEVRSYGEDTTRAYAADELNQYTAITNPTAAPDYDPDGNLIDDGVYDYTWNDAGRLTSVTKAGVKKVEYEYDYLGRRVLRVVSDWVTSSWDPVEINRYVYHGMQCIEELDNGGNVVKSYAWGLDVAGRLDMADSPFVSMAGAGGVGGLLAVNDGSDTYAYAYDGNGNVIALVDSEGNIDCAYRYGPYGQPQSVSESGFSNPYRFSTKFLETAFSSENETLAFGNSLDLYDYGFRWYHAQLGRWTSRDPLKEDGGTNLYQSSGNALVDFYDVLGMFNPAAILTGRMEYTCRCGWVDWIHASPKYIRLIRDMAKKDANVGTPTKPSGLRPVYQPLPPGVAGPPAPVGYKPVFPPMKFSARGKYKVTRSYSDPYMTLTVYSEVYDSRSYMEFYQTAFSVAMRGEYLFENAQNDEWTLGSSYSVEDLPSDAIAFYRSLYSIWKIPNADPHKLCRPIGRDASLILYAKMKDKHPKNKGVMPKDYNNLTPCCQTKGKAWPMILPWQFSWLGKPSRGGAGSRFTVLRHHYHDVFGNDWG